MKLSHILSLVSSDAWSIYLEGSTEYFPYLVNFLKNGDYEVNESVIEENKAANQVWFLNSDSGYKQRSDSPGEGKSVAVMPIHGALTVQDVCGKPGYESMTREFNRLVANENVQAILLDIKSPGGHARGLEFFSREIKSSSKAVVSFSRNMIASAAYMIASSGREIVVDGNASVIGSLGTMLGISEFKGIFEKWGAKFAETTATDSFDKNAAFKQLLEGDPKLIRSEYLDPLNKLFIDGIKNNRAGKLDLSQENVLTGKIYLTDNALKFGLIDHKNSFEFAVQRALELAKESSQSESNSTNNNMKVDMTTFPQFSNVLGIKPENKGLWAKLFGGKEENSLTLEAEQLEAIEKALADGEEAKQQVGTLKTEKGNLETQLNAEKEKVTNLTTEKTNLETKVTELQNAHVPAPGAAGNAEDGGNGEETEQEFYSETDAQLAALKKVNNK